jgi:predicted SAM-dependent methyltransferase
MKLHIGCGKKYLNDYIHIDVIDYEHIDYVCDTRELSVITNNTVSEIYACHILEHVKRNEVLGVLEEWYRKLLPGGSLRISVPNFEAMVEEYTINKNLKSFHGLLYGGQTYDYNFHHVCFDFILLKELLLNAGFSKIQRYDWKDFLPQGFDDYSKAYLPHLDFENGRHMSLNIIAIKNI